MTELPEKVQKAIKKLPRYMRDTTSGLAAVEALARLAIEETAKEAAEVCLRVPFSTSMKCADAIRARFGLKP